MTAPLASRLISAICAGSPEKYIRLLHQFGMGILLSLLLQQRAPGGRPCSARSPLPVGCSPRPVTGQADRGIPQPSSF
ncbi:hypothetical protein DWC96_20145 [Salmonella enterica]|uniref:Uncharacterized protein n=7 Tax=Enterobacteriaceae TaxID=543 RepID=A0A3K3Q582_ECOLX|nr:hypothetical protein AM448_25295 [Escherichia coli]EAA1439906.1 hypothetical protein [Shigella sonnei]EAN0132380.1 hypothetical protein [Salmonella enterica]EBM9427859.1 hypothetical protein [Salmonella enterica subsp. enterica serovar Heidelberg]EBR8153496.1 hypothetical protein [Salmonella enterica subsp. enterica serovar Enteritidis]EBU8146774.1 hypothetical protein [Salmonella enterica subsp. enterica serovar Typhimurium]EBU8888286.1 hypothetical protein [Salmonella enterica subsp. ent